MAKPLCRQNRGSESGAMSIAFTVLAALAALIPTSAHAQSHVWSLGAGGAGEDRPSSIVVDPDGDCVVAGDFGGSADFGGGPLVSAGELDGFVAKYDASGAHLWSQRFGDSGYDITPLNLATDSQGNVIIAATGRSMDFGGGELVGDNFLAKLAPDGTHLWSLAFDASSLMGYPDVDVDELDNILMGGSYYGELDLGGGPLPNDGGASKTYVAKFDSAGNHIWSDGFDNGSNQSPTAVCVDSSGGLVVTGHFSGTINLGGSDLTSEGGADLFLAKFDASGAHVFSQRFGDSEDQANAGARVSTGPNGDVVFTSALIGTMDMGGGPLSSAGAYDALVAVFEPNGAHVWSRQFGDTNYQVATDGGMDGDGVTTAVGYVLGTTDFGGGPLEANSRDFFVARFDANGVHLTSYLYGENGSQGVQARVAVFDPQNFVVSAQFQGSIDLGGGSLNSSGGGDVFVAKFGEGSVDVDAGEPSWTTSGLGLDPVMPNPARSTARIGYQIAVPQDLSLRVHDSAGRLVRVLYEGSSTAGHHSVTWDGRDDRGVSVPSGIYHATMTTGSARQSRSLVVLR